jgi:hypothetical protein
MPEKKLAQPLAASILFLSHILASSDQATNRFVRRGGPKPVQDRRHVTARQFLSIPTICLDTIASFDPHQRWGNDLPRYTERSQLPVQNIPGRPSLVAGASGLRRSIQPMRQRCCPGGHQDPEIVFWTCDQLLSHGALRRSFHRLTAQPASLRFGAGRPILTDPKKTDADHLPGRRT